MENKFIDIDSTEMLWNILNQSHEFPWPKNLRTQNKFSLSISKFAKNEKLKHTLNVLSKKEFNIKIREVLTPIIKNKNQTIEVAQWIVKDWGGIYRGSESINDWISELKDFKKENIDEFIKKMGNKRISSWSKILAFIDPLNYAIYDSRTTTSLNYGFYRLGSDYRFYIPPSRNPKMQAVRPYLVGGSQNETLGYSEYIYLLKLISKKCNHNKSILDIEMALFSNAPIHSDNFLSNKF